MQTTKKLFESRNADYVKLLDDLTLIFEPIFSKLVLPTCKGDPLNFSIDDYLNPKPYLQHLFEPKNL